MTLERGRVGREGGRDAVQARRDRQKLQMTFDEMWALASTSDEARAELQAALTYISNKVKGAEQ